MVNFLLCKHEVLNSACRTHVKKQSTVAHACHPSEGQIPQLTSLQLLTSTCAHIPTHTTVYICTSTCTRTLGCTQTHTYTQTTFLGERTNSEQETGRTDSTWHGFIFKYLQRVSGQRDSYDSNALGAFCC